MEKTMENKVNTLAKNLLELGYIVTVFDKIESVSEYLNSKIDNTSVGFAGSMTLEKSGLYDMLKTHNEVYWHHRIPEGKTSKDVRMQARDTKIYLTSANAISLVGEIVNIDATCNRVAEIFYGHEKVYFIIGANKIEDDYDKALYRARNIAAPKNAKRLGVNTPCAINADRCYNCKSPQRICRGLSVLWSKPMTGEYEVVLVKEDLGY
jgi:hypothetical protein